MEFMTKVTQRLRRVRTLGRLLREDGLINTTDLLVATGATVILAAGITGATLSALDEANYGKAQPDAQTIAGAINSFYADTGRWPGQAEQADNTIVFLATGAETTTGETFAAGSSTLPEVSEDGLKYSDSIDCLSNSGQGFVGGVNILGFDGVSSGSQTIVGTADTVKILDLNDYLVRDPGASYPNWAGPYVQQIDSDPWDRAWVAYLAPLYCSEIGGTSGAGLLGYAWLWSGGANRTITSSATDPDLDDDGDDAGVNLGKLTPSQSVTQ